MEGHSALTCPAIPIELKTLNLTEEFKMIFCQSSINLKDQVVITCEVDRGVGRIATMGMVFLWLNIFFSIFKIACVK